MLVVDYDQAVGRYFERESRRHMAMLRKAVMMGHTTDHRVTHFETNGVVVTSHVKPKVEAPVVTKMKPLTKLVN